MSSAKIIRFPKPFRRRPVPPAPGRYDSRPYLRPDPGGFALMMFLTVPAASLYLSGAVDVARHDTLYTALLAAAWGLYFFHDRLLRTRLGPLLIRAGRLLLLTGLAGFFGGIYWLIYRKG
jgi:hypothetical protein